MSKGAKIALVLLGMAALGGIAYWAFSESSKKSGVQEKDNRRITFTKS